ncbi:MAG: ATP-dependent dethiobiotin synthetase BioD 1 [Syntrophorhabdus sp. PtaU1.Bin153]|nr:MAG: ATP-dependent dethiobiotin synthetase BioD 1 [Syntrophorhabdus sp. PtaU1.Bin153]
MKVIFVTGTDTGVGKTVISSAISAFFSLRKQMNVGVMKPFECGLSSTEGSLVPGDAIRLREASGSRDDLNIISPYTLESPVAPEVAAMLEHTDIDLSLVDKIFQNLKKSHDLLIIEGAGGIFVPIRKNVFFLDLIQKWNAPALVVSRLSVGTINHTLLTVHFLKKQGIKILGVVLNNTDGLDGVAAETNPEILNQYLDVPFLGIFPHVKDLLEASIDWELMAETLMRNINIEVLLNQ